MTQAYVVMGVSGCGKTTIGQLLAQRLGCPFYDGDDFHPPQNVDKMARGVPLNDADRQPWLARLHDLLVSHVERGETAVLACSALKKSYRDQLSAGNKVQFIHLQGDFDLIWQRMLLRQDHYMKAAMLQSQFDTLEPPTADEALIISITQPVDILMQAIWQEIEVTR